MQKTFLILVLILIFIGCQKEKSELIFIKKSFLTDELEECQNSTCPAINISLLKAEGETELSTKINTELDAKIIDLLVSAPNDTNNIQTVNQGITDFIQQCRAYKSDYPETYSQYEVSIDTDVSYQSDSFLSIIIDTYSYTGGAHGYGSVLFLNFDKISKKSLRPEQLIKDKNALIKEAEKHFRNQQKIPLEENINSKGYFFENNKFSLPNNIGFDSTHMLLVYNPYEVASYAAGQIVVTIPIEKVRNYLSIAL